ncbi:hypothetical protein M9458_039793, partial [Cirrhinus mrigala]
DSVYHGLGKASEVYRIPSRWVPGGAHPLRKKVLPQGNLPRSGSRMEHEVGKPGLGGPIRCNQQNLLFVLDVPAERLPLAMLRGAERV